MTHIVTDPDEIEVPTNIQEGVEALQNVRPDERVGVVAAADNMLVVRLGTYDLRTFDPPWKHDEVLVFARIHPDFPEWTGNRKGFVTVPPLKRQDGALNNNAWDRQVGKSVEALTGKTAQTYSWKWSEVPMEEPSDMAYAHELAQRMLAYG